MDYVALCVAVLQSVAVCCRALQCAAVYISVTTRIHPLCSFALTPHCSALQCDTASRNLLLCVAVCCFVLQCVVVCCSVLQCVSVHTCYHHML